MFGATNEARFWDRIARKYATDPIADMAGYEHTLHRTRQLLDSDDTVFEFGCGTGTSALRLAPSVARIVATDISDEMIAIAREKAKNEGCTSIEFQVAMSDKIPWPDGSFDAALGFNVLHLVAAREASLHSVHRLLKPGGLFITKTPCLKEMNPFVRMSIPAMQLFGKAPYVSALDADELEREIADAGFKIIARERHASLGKDVRPFFVARKPEH